jgi:lysophospholipase L1-like esterase
MEAREAEQPLVPGGILFTGSSSIRFWKTLAEDFPGRVVINRGFGGSQISDLIGYFDRLVVPGQPAQIVIYSGTNDMNAGEPPEQVLADLATLSGMIRVALPEAKVAWISAAPNPARWDQREAQMRFNAWAAVYCAREGYDFISVWAPMLGAGGEPTREIYVADGLHMNAAGYAIWREVVEPYLIETK